MQPARSTQPCFHGCFKQRKLSFAQKEFCIIDRNMTQKTFRGHSSPFTKDFLEMGWAHMHVFRNVLQRWLFFKVTANKFYSFFNSGIMMIYHSVKFQQRSVLYFNLTTRKWRKIKKPRNKSVTGAFYYLKLVDYKNGAITKATTDISFNNIFKDGPEVSLKGSPTVSPTTVAL